MFFFNFEFFKITFIHLFIKVIFYLIFSAPTTSPTTPGGNKLKRHMTLLLNSEPLVFLFACRTFILPTSHPKITMLTLETAAACWKHAT